MKFRFSPVSPNRFGFLLALVFLGSALAAHAGTVSGTVRNGTNGKPAAGVEMILIQLQGGMQPVANTKTDGSGRYHFDNPNLGAAPMLLRAVYRGVFYHEPITPGKDTVDVQVFEPTDKSSAFSITAHAIILQPKGGGQLTIGEEYNVQNKTQPPVAYYREDGSFLFSLPEGAHLSDVSAVSSSGMPVIQTPVDKGKNQEAIAYAFRPGDSGVRITYDVPYPNDQTKLSFVSPYPASRVAVFVPPTMQVSGEGFAPAGQTQGFNVFMRSSMAANSPLLVSISGTAPIPTPDSGSTGAASGNAGGDASQDPSINSRADSGNTTAPTATATAMPARLDSLKWILVSGFVAIFALGLAYLLRQPQAASLAEAGGAAPAPIQAQAPVQTKARVQPAVAADSSSATQVNREVHGSIDELKDGLFRLELRRQAGTISEEEYAREHLRIQNYLRELVRG